MDADLWH
jgi:hypothetical protein